MVMSANNRRPCGTRPTPRRATHSAAQELRELVRDLRVVLARLSCIHEQPAHGLLAGTRQTCDGANGITLTKQVKDAGAIFA